MPPHLAGTAFRTADDGFHGITRGRLRGADVLHPFHGVSAVDIDTSTIFGRCLAYEPVLGPGVMFSHTTAAYLFGMPLPPSDAKDQNSKTLHVSVLGVRTPPHGKGITGRALTADDIQSTMVHGLPVVSAGDTWCHLASLLSREDLVAVGDFLISGRRTNSGREAPLATRDELAQAVRRRRGRRGARNLGWALPLLRTAVDSRPESRLRLLLLAFGLPEPLVNPEVAVEEGALILHPDLCYQRWRVVFEYEGAVELRGSRQRSRDPSAERACERGVDSAPLPTRRREVSGVLPSTSSGSGVTLAKWRYQRSLRAI